MSTRSISIDVLRGATLAAMILVNMSISDELSYAPLLHAKWHGLTFTDVVFPTFLFAVGASLAFVLPRYQQTADHVFLGKVFRRTAMLFIFGYLMYWFPFFKLESNGLPALLPLENTRVLGVLQRIALSYGIAALVIRYFGLRGALLYSVATLMGYWWLMATFGDYTLSGNAALKIDRALLGDSHMYKGEGIPFDPEGIVGTLPSVVNILSGYVAMQFLHRKAICSRKLRDMMIIAAGLIAVALAWDSQFPINKKLWSSSYVVCTVGIDLLLLALVTGILDIFKVKRGIHFFEVFGRNTLFIYLLAEVLMSILWLAQVGNEPLFMWLYANGFQWWAGGKNGSLLFGTCFMMFCWLIGYIMDKRHIYIRL